MMIFGFDFVRGSGNVEARDYDVKGFRSVRLAGIGTLSIEQSGEESLRVEAEDNLLPYLRVEVRGSELYLGVERNISLRPTRPIKYFLTARDMEGILLTGSGSVHTSALKAPRLELGLTGSGDIDTGSLTVEREFSLRITGSGQAEMTALQAGESEISITGSGKVRSDTLDSARLRISITGSGDVRLSKTVTQCLETRISGSGDVELAGKTVEQELIISAIGKYRARDFESERAQIRISGSGSAWVAVKDRLDARISGSGSIHYAGRPVVVQSISGSGKVKYMEE